MPILSEQEIIAIAKEVSGFLKTKNLRTLDKYAVVLHLMLEMMNELRGSF
jgi:hypothetical protein